MKKFIAGLIAGIILSAVPAAFAIIVAPKIFSDVKESDWYYTPVSQLTMLGVVNGYDDGTFRPKDLISRAEIAQIVYGTYKKLTPKSDYNQLKNQFDALRAKVNTLSFPGDCYYQEKWYKIGESVADNNFAFCQKDGTIQAPLDY